MSNSGDERLLRDGPRKSCDIWKQKCKCTEVTFSLGYGGAREQRAVISVSKCSSVLCSHIAVLESVTKRLVPKLPRSEKRTIHATKAADDLDAIIAGLFE